MAEGYVADIRGNNNYYNLHYFVKLLIIRICKN